MTLSTLLTQRNNMDKDNEKKPNLTFNVLAQKANNHLNHIVFSSKNKDELLFKLSGFYGGLLEVLRENKLL